MKHRIKIEITGRNEFWRQAVMVEWEHLFPERKLVIEGNDFYLIEAAWLEDLRQVARRCFSDVRLAPEDLSRRLLLRCLFPRHGE